ncbi:hypothetical protein KP509_05G066500 [Ceratopteris richardii]|uniref:BZIP domain-containing protein n=1 Tax=Ceratopteris richardii TaxID=49495 RepID=A0A8T2URG1_CERRI|nr:hypothetical protein KP509_05G066500 [Ceratopteris richardii]
MEGMGESYEAFLERLHSDFSVSKGSGQNGSPSSSPVVNHGHGHSSGASMKGTSKLNCSPFPTHLPPSRMPHPKYVGYPSPANAFTVKKDESSSSSSSTGRPPVDATKDEKPSSMGFSGVSRTVSSDLVETSDIPYHPRRHRRAQSETAFRLPDDIVFDYDPGCLEASAETDELGDDFSSILDLEKMNLSSTTTHFPPTAKPLSNINKNTSVAPHHARSYSVDQMFDGFTGNEDPLGYVEEQVPERPRHRHSHSYSMDGSSMPCPKETSTSSGDSSKSVSANKLAELALIDPKRAKRILANRQSAARSKERKMRYIAELERKVHALQTEATTLSAQLSIMQNDTTVLTAENNELKFQLQSLEQQTHLSTALNIALKEEVQKLKIATGEVMKNGQSRSRDDHPLLSSKPFYRSQPRADSIFDQQLQQLHAALKQQQITKHQSIL